MNVYQITIFYNENNFQIVTTCTNSTVAISESIRNYNVWFLSQKLEVAEINKIICIKIK